MATTTHPSVDRQKQVRSKMQRQPWGPFTINLRGALPTFAKTDKSGRQQG